MNEIDLNEIAVFVKVIQAGSFSQAARQLGMPNSTVSLKISSLESRLGVTLLHRTTRKLNLTQAGEAFYERALKSVGDLKNAALEATSQQEAPKGVLRLTAPAVLGSALLPEVISNFSKLHPLVKLDLFLSDRRVDLVSEGVDLAIRAGILSDSSLIAKKIGVSYFAPFASRAYLKQMGTPSHPKDLRDHRCLHFTPLGKDSWDLVSTTKVRVSIQSSLSTDDLYLVKNLTVAGYGIGLLPTFLCGNETADKTLVRILPEWKSEVRPVQFVYPPQKFLAPKIQAFMATASEILRTRLKDLEI